MCLEKVGIGVPHQLLKGTRKIVLVLKENFVANICTFAFRVEHANELERIDDVAFVVRCKSKLLDRLGCYGRWKVPLKIADHLSNVSRAGNVRMSCQILSPKILGIIMPRKILR
jgi:hypothetical protein